MHESSFRRRRVVMATVGSLGDLHPYIALALEMKKRNVEPVIATTEIYRARLESLDIEFHPLRTVMPEHDSPEGVEMIDKVMDPKRGAEYLFKELLVPAVRDAYQDLSHAIADADLLITHPIVLAGPPLAQKMRSGEQIADFGKEVDAALNGLRPSSSGRRRKATRRVAVVNNFRRRWWCKVLVLRVA